MAYVYRHVRLDKNEVFYIGIGSDDEGYYERAIAKNPLVRNEFWVNITNKTDYVVEIMLDNLTWGEACCKEVELIKLYGRRNKKEGTLCNLTDGGEGVVGFVMSETAKQAISKALTGIKRSTECRLSKSKSMLGSKLSGVTKEIMSQRKQQWWNTHPLTKGMKTVLDLETGFFFDSVAGAARANNISRNRMCKIMKYGRRFKYV